MFKAEAKFLGSNQLQTIAIKDNQSIQWNNTPFNVHQLTWQTPVSGTVYGTLLNFQGEYDAIKSEMNQPPYQAPPEHPILYIQPANTMNSHLRPVPLPKEDFSFEVGAGLGVMIGSTATHLTEDTALNYVAGYTVVADYSIPHTSFYRPDIKNKVRDQSCVIGPWIIDHTEITNPDELGITVHVNEKKIQENNTKNMIRSVATLLTDVTEFMTLTKGDVLIVGTPENKPVVRKDDKVTVEIDQIGQIENSIVAEGGA